MQPTRSRRVGLAAAAAYLALVLAACTSNPQPTEPTERTESTARPCAGIPDREAETALDAIRPNIDGVEAKKLTTYPGKGTPWQQLVGAVIYVRATPGMTAPYLTRLLRCHALEHVPTLCTAKGGCPFALRGAQINATPTSTGFAVSIASEEPEIAAEILQRSQELGRSP